MPPNPGTFGKTKLIIIGGGIAGYSLAHEAAKLEIGSLVLDNGQSGTTHSATGILDARADHLVRDIGSVIQTDREIIEWQNSFSYEPRIVKPRHFLMPIDENTPHSVFAFDTLFEFYEKVAWLRLNRLPDKHRLIPASLLERMEPNLKRGRFKSAVSFWLWTVDPDALLRKVKNEAVMFSPFAKRLLINRIVGFKIKCGNVEEIVVEDYESKKMVIGNLGPLVVVNTTGPWIGETLKPLGIKFPVELKLGVQTKFPGHYFQSDSGLMTFGKDGKYVICLQEKGYLQVGPTSSDFDGQPGHIGTATHDLNYLEETLSDILEEGYLVPAPEILKYGWRVKPKYIIDTDRPLIWHHQKEGFSNLYTTVPGKMILGLLTARELLARLTCDGWLGGKIAVSCPKLALDGNRPCYNQLKLAWFYIKSHLILGWPFLKKLTKKSLFI